MEKIYTSLSECFERQVQQTPSAIACVEGANTLTYQALDEKANQLAEFLKEQGMVPYTLVAVWGQPSIRSVIATVAIIKAGGAYIGLSDSDPFARQQKILSHLHPAFIICTENTSVSLPKTSGKLIFLADLEDVLTGYSKEDHPISLNEDRLGTVIYRSDPTGYPTGVMIEQRSIINLMLNPPFLDKAYIQSILYHHAISKPAAMFEIWAALLNGYSIIITSSELQNIKPDGVLMVMNRYQYDSLSLKFPDWFEKCSSILLYNNRKVAAPLILPKKLIYVDGYLETTFIACYRMNQEPTMPLSNVKIYLLDKRLKSVRTGKVGEVYVAGTQLARGYLNQPDLTKKRFVIRDGERVYRTGDQAKWLENGVLAFQARLDREMEIQGEQVCPEEIEAAIMEAPDLEKAFAVLDENEKFEFEMNVYLTPNQSNVRIAYDKPCQLIWEDGSIEKVQVKDLSKSGIGIIGTDRIILLKEKLEVRLPDLTDEGSIPAEAVWQIDNKLGISFLEPHEAINDFIGAYFKTQHNIIPQKRNVRQLLEKRLPSYMLPVRSVLLSSMPLVRFGELDRGRLRKIYEKVRSIPFDLGKGSKNGEGKQASDPDEALKRELLSNGSKGKKISKKLLTDYEISVSGRDIFSNIFYKLIAKKIYQALIESETKQIPHVSKHHGNVISAMQEQYLQGGYLVAKKVLIGKLTDKLVRKILEKLHDRHEILNIFYEKDASGKIKQSLIKNSKFDIQYFSTDSKFDKILSAIEVPFNLEQGPLCRALWIQKKDLNDELWLVFHESIVDSRSLSIIAQDLKEIFQAELEEREAQLPILPIQYIDYAVWERKNIGERLSNPTGSYRLMQVASFKISPSMTSALQGYCMNVGSTLPLVLMAAFYVVWKKLTGKNDFTILINAVNRDREDVNDLVGVLEKKIAMHIEAKEGATFKELVEEVNNVYLKNDHEIQSYDIHSAIGFYFEDARNVEILKAPYSPHAMCIHLARKGEHIVGSFSYIEGTSPEVNFETWHKAWILSLQLITSDPDLTLDSF